MEIVNADKLDKSKTVVFLGKEDDIAAVRPQYIYMLSWYPYPKMHFTEYQQAAVSACKEAALHNGAAAIATQSKEFLDELLATDFDLQIVTVRRDPDMSKYRLRVLSKKEAAENREAFDMELRI